MQNSQSYDMIECGALAVNDGKIAWVGEESQIPKKFFKEESEDLNGYLCTPGLIDCHTHIVHGGDRSAEFELRLNGATYQEISEKGGGIVSTVESTRNSSVEELLELALPRVDKLISEGLTFLEIKSGYGLDCQTELKMLRAARKIPKLRPINVTTSFLGAHAIPIEYKGSPDDYIDEVCIPTLRAAHSEGLVDAVDAFCENIAFNVDQVEKVFKIAGECNLPIKIHSEQLSHMGGTKLAAEYGALSADHLEYASISDIIALAKAKTVAVLLPGAFYTLRETQSPPIRVLREEKVDIAVATDCNPGSSPMTSLLLAMNMACTFFQLTPLEALAGVTCNAAKALGLSNCGSIEIGKRADLCVWKVKHPAELSYKIGFNPLYKRIFGGQS